MVGSRPFTASSASLDLCARNVEVPVSQKRLGPLSRHCGEGAIEVLRTACLHMLKADAQRSGGSFQVSHLKCTTLICRFRKDGHSGGAGDGLLQNLQPLAE